MIILQSFYESSDCKISHVWNVSKLFSFTTKFLRFSFQIFCNVEDTDMVLKIVDKHLATIGASRARGENIKSVARFYGISDSASTLFSYTRDTCKIRIDADGRVGSVCSAAVGGCEPDAENENGKFLRSCLTIRNLADVNTFHQAGPTWTGSRGHGHRIDYICVPVEMNS